MRTLPCDIYIYIVWWKTKERRLRSKCLSQDKGDHHNTPPSEIVHRSNKTHMRIRKNEIERKLGLDTAPGNEIDLIDAPSRRGAVNPRCEERRGTSP